MANDVASLVIEVDSKGATKAEKDLSKLSKTAANTDKGVTKLDRSFDKLTKTVSSGATALNRWGGFAAVAAATGTAIWAKSMIDANDKLGKLSTRLGASTEALSEYKHVAELSGVTFETLTMGWQRMTRRVAEASIGMGEAQGALEELGISAVELAKLKPEQQFEILAEELSKVKTDADRVRLSMKLFDSEGVSLIQTMKGGSAGLREMRLDARNLGLTISGETAASAEKFNDDLTKMKAAMAGAGQSMLSDIMEPLTEISAAMALATKEGGILTGIFVGLGGVASHLFFGSEEAQRTNELTAEMVELTNQAEEIEGRIEKLDRWDGALQSALYGDETELNAELATTQARLKAVRDELKAMREQEAAPTDAPQAEGQAAGAAAPGVAVIGQEAVAAEAEAQAHRDGLASKIEALEMFYSTEEELAIADYESKLELLTEHEELKLETDANYAELRLAAAQEFSDKMTDIAVRGEGTTQKAKDALRKREVKDTISAGQALLSGVSKQSKAAFEVNKVAAASSAAIKGKDAAVAAWDAGMQTGGPFAPLVAAAYTAASIANTGSMIAGIRSQSYGGGGGASAPSASTPTAATPDTGAADEGIPAPTEIEGAAQRTLNVTVEGDGPHSDGMRQFAVNLAETIRDMGGTDNLVLS